MGFTFNGERRDYITVLQGRRRPAWAPRTLNWLNVPGMTGAYLEGVETSPRPYDVPIRIKANGNEDLQKIKEDLAEWLLHDEMKELIFDDEPDRTYLAIVDGTLDLDELVRVGKGVISFICDPYKYGPEKEAIFTSDAVSLDYEGTAPGDPIFELEVLQPVTFAMIQNQNDEYMMIGKPTDVIDTPYEKYERVFYSVCNNLTGWTNATNGEIDGNIAGTMETNGTRFQASDFGIGSSWHGPAIKTSLSEPLTDFRLTAYVGFFNKSVAKQVGRIEIYLLDVNGNQVGKIAMKDIQSSRSVAWGEARAGDNQDNHYLINEYGDKPGNWNDFSGHVRIEREGNVWRAYFAKVDSSGRHHTRRFAEWVDTENKFNRTVAQIVVHHGQYGSHEPVSGGVYSLNVYKINQEQENEVPYIAQPGDIITFDHKEKLLLINGEPRKDLKDFGARYFKLYKGENNLIVHTSDSFNVTCKYRERFK